MVDTIQDLWAHKTLVSISNILKVTLSTFF